MHGVSLEIRAGEIVGLAGLVGAGRSEVARAIFGAVPSAPRRSGRVQRARQQPAAALNAQVTLIPKSRKDDGLMLRRPVRENVSLASVRRLARFGFVRRGSETDQVRSALTSVSASGALETAPEALSGRNQQKFMFARALLAKPSVLLADDPTRGVDVGAKRDLYQLIVELAARGVGILLVSNEIEEILGLAHRVLVMRGGRIVAELSGTRSPRRRSSRRRSDGHWRQPDDRRHDRPRRAHRTHASSAGCDGWPGGAAS